MRELILACSHPNYTDHWFRLTREGTKYRTECCVLKDARSRGGVPAWSDCTYHYTHAEFMKKAEELADED